MNKQNILGRL